jgi:hypothetical protein
VKLKMRGLKTRDRLGINVYGNCWTLVWKI